MKSKQTRRNRKLRRKSNKRRTRRYRKQCGGADLPIPRGSVASVRLDPKDEYSAPVLVRKEEFEEEVLED